MTSANRVKETTTSTNTATITLSGASSGFRSFSSALSGASDIEVMVGPDSAGAWLIGTYTLTNATTLARTAIIDSSASGADVVLAAGVKDVYNTVSSKALTDGMLNPNDAGFDIILLAGQSNMAGRGTSDTLIDFGDSRLFQWDGSKIINGADPLYHAEGVATGKAGPGTWLAKSYLSQVPPNRRVLLVPAASGGTTLVGGAPLWYSGNPGGSLYEGAITRTNNALAAAKLLYPNSRVVGIAWHQGESDADNSVTQADYAAALKAVVAGFRSRITGAASSWLVIGGMCPEVINLNTTNSGRYPLIDLAHKQVAAETNKAAFVAGPTGYRLDSWHYTADGSRQLGSRMGLAVRAAIAYSTSDTIAPTAGAASVANGTPSIVSIAMSEALDAAYVPAAIAFSVAGRTVSSPTISGSTLTITVSPAFAYGDSATVSYTPPESNALRDLAGNAALAFGPLSIVNGLAAPVTAPAQMAAPTAVAGVNSASITLTAPGNGGSPITGYTVTSNPAGGVDSAAGTTALTRTITGLVAGTAYTFSATATNAAGTSVASPASNSVTPTSAATVPGAPTIGTAVAGDGYVDVVFTVPASNGGATITSYTATLSTGESNTGTASPIRVTAANGSARTAHVSATNSVGTGANSAESNSVTPAAAAAAVTWNPADSATGITLSGGNLTATGTSGWKSTRATTGKTTGKWYWETKITTGASGITGFGMLAAALTTFPGGDTPNGRSWGFYSTGARYYNNGAVETLTSYTTNDVIGIALNMDAKTAQFYKNGVALGSPFTLLDSPGGSALAAGTAIYPMLGVNGTAGAGNFGATAFAYTPPTGFIALTA